MTIRSLGLLLGALVLQAAMGPAPIPPVNSAPPAESGSLRKVASTAQEYISGRNYKKAISYLERAISAHGDDGEFHRLVACACLDQCIELDDHTDNTLGRLLAVTAIRQAVSEDSSGDFEPSKANVDATCERLLREFRSQRADPLEVRRLLQTARREAARAVDLRGTDPAAVNTAIWLDAYQTLTVRRARTLAETLRRFKQRTPVAVEEREFLGPDYPLDGEEAARKHALGLLANSSAQRPKSPWPYVAAAEWLSVVPAQANPQSSLERVRSARYSAGILQQSCPTLDQAAREELERLRRIPVEELTTATAASVPALYERARGLDPGDSTGSRYGYYLQLLVGDPESAAQILNAIQQADPRSAVGPLERARCAAEDGTQSAQALQHLQDARGYSHVHRPLFVSMPKEIRAPLLGAHSMWHEVRSASLGYKSIERFLARTLSAAADPTSKVNVLLLKAEIGRILMTSDLPHDSVLGTKLRQGALAALTRIPNLAPDFQARLSIEEQRARAAAASGFHPFLFAVLWKGEVQFVPAADGDLVLTAPFIIVGADGTVGIGK